MLKDFKAYQLAKHHYLLCKRLILPEFMYDQLRRASSSVALNLAEGSGKRTPADRRRFYSIAFGSLRECSALIELEEINDPELLRIHDELSAVTYTLIRNH
jgi:four helix bundle protein